MTVGAAPVAGGQIARLTRKFNRRDLPAGRQVAEIAEALLSKEVRDPDGTCLAGRRVGIDSIK